MVKPIEDIQDEKIRNFCLSTKKQVKIIETVYPHCHAVGTYKKLNEFNNVLVNVFQNKGVFLHENVKIWQYLRLLKDDKLYVSDLYRRDSNLKTNSSVILFVDDHQPKLG